MSTVTVTFSMNLRNVYAPLSMQHYRSTVANRRRHLMYINCPIFMTYIYQILPYTNKERKKWHSETAAEVRKEMVRGRHHHH